jgi:hypothetical protein
MGAKTLAFRTGTSVLEAESLLRMLARTYPTFTEWQSRSVDAALLRGHMETCYGWRVNVTTASRPTALRNYPMQAHGAEMLRIACCLATESGVRVCAPVHDVLLIEAAIDLIDDVVITTRGAMAEAAAAVLGPGVWIDTDGYFADLEYFGTPPAPAPPERRRGRHARQTKVIDLHNVRAATRMRTRRAAAHIPEGVVQSS